MRKTILMMLLASHAWAAPIDDAAAHDRGDYATELRITRPLAAMCDAWAQYNLGVMYGKGQGVPQDYAVAVRW